MAPSDCLYNEDASLVTFGKKIRWRWLIGFAIVLVIVVFVLILMQQSMVAELAPGAREAITKALGSNGLNRVGQVISPRNLPSLASGATHLQSGVHNGQPYGLAFDILITNPANADSDTRALRLAGIAAWHRGSDAPGGPAGLGPHIHCVWPGAVTKNEQNVEQISSFVHGYRALADANLPKKRWTDASIRADEIMAVRHAYAIIPNRNPLHDIRTYDEMHRSREVACYACPWTAIAWASRMPSQTAA